MKASEFAAWLEGYLDGKDSLNKTQAKKIMEKARSVEPEYISTPITWISNAPLRWSPYHSGPIPIFPGAMIGNDLSYQTVCSDSGTIANNQISYYARGIQSLENYS